MDKEMQQQLVAWLRLQARNEDEMIAFNTKMKSESASFEPLIPSESHELQAKRLRTWADAVANLHEFL